MTTGQRWCLLLSWSPVGCRGMRAGAPVVSAGTQRPLSTAALLGDLMVRLLMWFGKKRSE